MGYSQNWREVRIWILQIWNSKPTGAAVIKIVMDALKDGSIKEM